MRISDWSSDVCSSDLSGKIPFLFNALGSERKCRGASFFDAAHIKKSPPSRDGGLRMQPDLNGLSQPTATRALRNILSHGDSYGQSSRSEERRVGTECVSTCRYQWLTYN